MKKLKFWDKSTRSESVPLSDRELLYKLLVHDMRSPLSIISTTANTLLRKRDCGPLSDSQRSFLERISRNATRAQTLLQEMVELYRAEEGFFQKESVMIRKVLKESLIGALERTKPEEAEKLIDFEDDEMLERILKSQRITVEMTGRYRDSSFYHDSRKIQQILQNLLSNGLKYRSDRLSIKIRGDEDLLISVEDDGPGISVRENGPLFERFGQLNTNRGREESGLSLSLGLVGVKTLVDAMKGEMKLVSCKGTGTCITIRIPSLHAGKEGGN